MNSANTAAPMSRDIYKVTRLNREVRAVLVNVADISGMLSVISLVRCVSRLTSRGKTAENAGTSKTSSNVRASSLPIPLS